MTTLTDIKQPLLRRIAAAFSRLDRLTKFVLIAFVLAGAVTGVLAFGFVRQFVESTPSGVLPGLVISDTSGNDAGETINQPASSGVYNYTRPDPWDGSSRVNILVMGLDARDWEAGSGAPRTDSMIVLTYDPVTKTAGMLSVPRDLWVNIPGFGSDKINNAYALGEGNRLPGGGAGLAVKTVEEFLGITINYYAQIDFSAFVRFIDIIGGVKIDVPSDIRVDIIGQPCTRREGGQEVNVYTTNGCYLIKSGRQVLNGDLALAYARNRHDPGGDGDIDRARRQQQIILAVRQQLARDDVRALVLNNALQIYDALASGINTNMSIEDAFSLGWAVKDINIEDIEQGVIGPPDYGTYDTSPDGESIIKPFTENIRLLRDQVFAGGSARSPLALTSQDIDLMKMEAANVVVNNGSGNSGIADSTRAYLEAQGMIIVSTGNADLVNGTTIIDYTGNPYTVQYLANLMSVNSSHIFSSYDPNSSIDVEIIIGPEWVVPQ